MVNHGIIIGALFLIVGFVEARTGTRDLGELSGLQRRMPWLYFFFLIVAPPLEVSNQYLPVLGKIAQFSKEPDVPQRLLGLTEPQQFMALLAEKGV